MVEIESTSENVRSYESTARSSSLDLNDGLKAERNGTSSSFEEFGYLRKRGRYLESLVYITTRISRDKKHGGAHSERLRYSWCEPKRVSVRAWYAFLSTYD
jgi:hypothetical protein